MKLKSLLKEGVNVDENVKEDQSRGETVNSLLQEVSTLNISVDNIILSQDTREVAVHIAGYIAKKFIERGHACCKAHLTGTVSEDNEDHAYIRILSRGGLTIPSDSLTDYVCSAFSILDLTEVSIKNSELPARKAAEVVLTHIFDSYEDFTCNLHKAAGQSFAHRVISNVFFNNKRKILTSSMRKDSVVSFKKRQREK